MPAPVPALADKTCVEVACGTAVSFAVTDSGSSPWGSAIFLPVKFAGLWIQIRIQYTSVAEPEPKLFETWSQSRSRNYIFNKNLL